MAKIITTAIVVSFSYLTQKNYTFKSESPKQTQSVKTKA
jgi:putative flippase GtrA